MQFNRHSIFLKLNLLFLIASITLSVVFFVFLHLSQKRAEFLVANDSRHIMRLIRNNNRFEANDLQQILKEEGFELINDPLSITKNAKEIIIKRPREEIRRDRLPPKRVKILQFDKRYYFDIDMPTQKLLIKNREYPNNFIWIQLVYLVVMTVLLIIYLALRRSLKPIKTLKSQINRYGEGEIDIDTRSNHKDEIAELANAFHDTTQKINLLQHNRTLFLRNLMHELKTPITKGKLSLSLMEQNSESEMLERVFLRLETLINETADIEKITSGHYTLEPKTHHIEDIIDQASTLLYLEEDQVTHALQKQKITCDFTLFTIAVKNLIDNAIKYADDHRVVIESRDKTLSFISLGKPLGGEFEKYTEPFYKGALKEANQKGFGLGLYIVSEIVKIHGFRFSYRHEDGKNIFEIVL